MNDFNSLVWADDLLFRGSSGSVARAIMSHAVGPVRAVAQFIFENGLDVADAEREAVYSFFQRATTMPAGRVEAPGAPSGTPYVAAPGSTLADRLGTLLKVPGLSWNPFTVFEHVLYEPEAQINHPRTARLLESLSQDPRTAILYAYGILPDPWWDGGIVKHHDNRPPNSDAFVAATPNAPSVNAEAALSALQNIATPNALNRQEAMRRMQRDAEVHLAVATVPQKVVNLDAFVQSKPNESLNAAAERLVAAGLAQWGGTSCP